MADLGTADEAGTTPPGAGPFSRLARMQYAALVTMRWRVFVIGLRSIRGLFELGASGIELMIFSFLGLGMSIGLGIASYGLASRGMWTLLPIEFWLVCVLWQVIPVALASFQDQFDMSGLLRFPVSFGAYYVLYVIFGLADASTVLGVLCCVGMWIGIIMVEPGLFAWLALVLVCFAAFNILLARTILAWIDRWLAQRRTREIVSALFLLLVVGLQLLNPAVGLVRYQDPRSPRAHAVARHRQLALKPYLRPVEAVQAWLPPGLAARALQEGAEDQLGSATGSLGLLGLAVAAIGGILGLRLRAEYRGENLGEAPSRKKAESREGTWALGGAGPVGAVIEKELRTLIRSMPQLYALGVPIVMVFVIGSLFRTGASAIHHPFSMAMPICVAYGLLGFTRLIYNNLGIEGAGIQMLFLSPTPVRTVLMAKNLFHAMLYGIAAVLAGLLAVFRLGVPDAAVVGVTVAWLVFALPANLAVGNVLSLTMPYRVNPGRLTRQPGSQANALLSMLIQTTLLGVGAAVCGSCMLWEKLWVAVPILLALSCVSLYAWMRVLGNVDAMANDRKELLLGTLGKLE